MKRFIIVSLLFVSACSMRAQTILGKHPADKVMPEFFSINGNADAFIDGLNANATHTLNTGVAPGNGGGPGGGTGNVNGPNSATANHLPLFSDTTGKVLGDSGIALSFISPWANWNTNAFGSAAFASSSAFDLNGAATAAAAGKLGTNGGRLYNTTISNSPVALNYLSGDKFVDAAGLLYLPPLSFGHSSVFIDGNGDWWNYGYKWMSEAGTMDAENGMLLGHKNLVTIDGIIWYTGDSVSSPTEFVDPTSGKIFYQDGGTLADTNHNLNASNFVGAAANITGGIITNGGILLIYGTGAPSVSAPDGSHYYRSTGQEYSRTNGNWVAINISGTGSGGTGDMVAANNLSDVANKAAALATLGGMPTNTGVFITGTNAGLFITNATGWAFIGTNGVQIESNAVTTIAKIRDVNGVETWKSNGIAYVVINPTDGSVRLLNSVANKGLVSANTIAFNEASNSLPDEPAIMHGDFSFTGAVTANSFAGDGSALTDIDADNVDGLVDLSGLKANQGMRTDGGTNITSTLDGSFWTNTVTWFNPGYTNVPLAFNGTIQTLSLTNAPKDVFFTFTGANGSIACLCPTNTTIHLPYPVKWFLGASNTVVTNGVIEFDSYGGTNYGQLWSGIGEGM